MLKKYLIKKEMKKLTKLANKTTTVLMTSGDTFIGIYDKLTGKTIYPKYNENLIVVR